jgi:hypothetical protein
VRFGVLAVQNAPWAELVDRWDDAGFEELVLFYPWERRMPEGSVEPGPAERMLGKG